MAPPPNNPPPPPPPPPTPPSGPNPSRDPQDGNPHPPHALKRTVVKPPSHAGGVDPIDSAFVANRLTTLTHELSSLLDGSLRVIGIAKRSVDTASTRHDDICPEKLARQLDTVRAAMVQMAELIRASMMGLSEGGLAAMRTGFGAGSSVQEAVRHAVDVMTPLAEEGMIRVDVDVTDDLHDVGAGPIYAVITNGVRNAIESIMRQGNRFVGGHVHVRAWTQSGRTGKCVMIEIMDDGEGLPPQTFQRASAGRMAEGPGVFALGFSTKEGGTGVGLALSRDIVQQLGGTIELRARPRDATTGRAGAVLSVCYPVPRRIAEAQVG